MLVEWPPEKRNQRSKACPVARVSSSPALHGTSTLSLEAVGRLFPVQVSLDDVEGAWKVAGVACLARCRELLAAALASYQAGVGGVAAVLYRSLYTFWLWGHHLLAAEDEAASLILKEREWHVEKLAFGRERLSAEGVPLGEPEVPADDEPLLWESVKPNLREVAQRVADLRGVEHRALVLAVHESSWRRASFVAAHPSWAVLRPYAVEHRAMGHLSVETSAEPWAASEDDVMTHVCAGLLLELAEKVVERLCLPKRDELDHARRRLAMHRF